LLDFLGSGLAGFGQIWENWAWLAKNQIGACAERQKADEKVQNENG
jgi:hypothetical protein